MKKILNWRYMVLFILSLAAMTFLLAAVGDPVDNPSDTDLLIRTICLVCASLLCGVAIVCLTRRWELGGKIKID